MRLQFTLPLTAMPKSLALKAYVWVCGCVHVFSLAEASLLRPARVERTSELSYVDGERFLESEQLLSTARIEGVAEPELSDDDGEVFYESEQWDHKALRQPGSFVSTQPHGKDKCLILYHIPKCAGSSLMKYFNDNGLRLWTHYGDMTGMDHLPRTDRSDKDFEPLDADIFMGHFMPKNFKQKLREFGMTRNCYEATVLRDPFERVASALYFHQSLRQADRNGDQDQELHVQRMSHASVETLEYFDDICRRFQTGHSMPWDGYSQSYRESYKSACNVSQAKEQLSALDFVLFTEDFQTVLTTFGSIFGIRPASPTFNSKSLVKNKSRNPGFKDLNPKLRDLIEKANLNDSELYNWAVQTMRAGHML